MPFKPPRIRPAGQEYKHLYRDKRWHGPHGIRLQVLVRDLYTCQRCDCLLVTTDRHHPRAAVVNHKRPHKGDETLFFDIGNCEAVCKSCHDALIQREEKRGYVIGCDVDGRPVDPAHPWNQSSEKVTRPKGMRSRHAT